MRLFNKKLKGIDEKLEKEVLPKDEPQNSLSTTRNSEDLISDITIATSIEDYELIEPRNANQFIPVWRKLSISYIEIQEAMDEIITEAIVSDDLKDTIRLDFKVTSEIPDRMKTIFTQEWEYLYNIMNLDENAEDIFKRFYVDGIIIGEAIYDNDKINKGVVRVDILEPQGMVREYSKKLQKFIYYRSGEHYNSLFSYNYNLSSRSDDDKKSIWLEDQIVSANSGVWDPFNKIFLSYLNLAIRPLNQLKALENSVTIYALTRSTEKMIYYVDVGRINDKKGEAKINKIARQIDNVPIYNNSTGDLTNTKDKIKLSKNIYIPVQGDKSTRIEQLAADNIDIGEMPALQYFQDKVYRALKVPRLRRNADSTFSFGESMQIEREEYKFFRFITKLRHRFSNMFKETFKRHLIAKNIITEEEWDSIYKSEVKFVYNNANNYDKINRIVNLRQDLEIISQISEFTVKNETGELPLFTSDYIYKNIITMTDDEINELKKEVEEERIRIDKLTPDEPKEENESVNQDKIDMLEELENNSDKNVKKIVCDLDALEDLIDNLQEGDEVVSLDNKDDKYVVENGELVPQK